MIFSDCYGDCHIGEIDLIVRGPQDQIKHELMHVLIELHPVDVLDVFEKYMLHLKSNMEDLQDGE